MPLEPIKYIKFCFFNDKIKTIALILISMVDCRSKDFISSALVSLSAVLSSANQHNSRDF